MMLFWRLYTQKWFLPWLCDVMWCWRLD